MHQLGNFCVNNSSKNSQSKSLQNYPRYIILFILNYFKEVEWFRLWSSMSSSTKCLPIIVFIIKKFHIYQIPHCVHRLCRCLLRRRRAFSRRLLIRRPFHLILNQWTNQKWFKKTHIKQKTKRRRINLLILVSYFFIFFVRISYILLLQF